MTTWTRVDPRCESSWCLEKHVDAAGNLHLRDSNNPDLVLVLPRRDALVLTDAARRGELYPFGTSAVG